MYKKFLETFGIPQSTIDVLEKGDETLDIEKLANEDREAIGKAYADTHPIKDKEVIIEAKNAKRVIAKLLRDSGIDLGDLSVSKIEEMSSKDIETALKPKLDDHLKKIKTSTDETKDAEIQRLTKLTNDLNDQLETVQKNSESEIEKVKGTVEEQLNQNRMMSHMSRLNADAKWAFTGKPLEMVQNATMDKIKGLGVVFNDDGSIKTKAGGPVTVDNKIIKNVTELHTHFFSEAFPKSNGVPVGSASIPGQTGTTESPNASAMEKRMQAYQESVS